jgi:hypothetical protein
MVCEFHDKCEMSEFGPHAQMDYQTAYIQTDDCVISNIAYYRAKILGYSDKDDCDNSDYGCCYVPVLCDSYVKKRLSFNIYNNSLHDTIDGGMRGYIKLQQTMNDFWGTNCPSDIFALVNEYQHLKKLNYEYNIDICIYLFIFVTLCICANVLYCLRKKKTKYNELTPVTGSA